MRIRIKGYIEVAASELAEIEAHLPEHIRLTRAETGCLQFDVTQRKETPSVFDVVEEFADAAAYEASRHPRPDALL